ncbi:MAG: hypothetical protein HYY97_04435 [Rhodocyclales bacterium]|nr:hypothetical protein [Rhodocyclales bacterium]
MFQMSKQLFDQCWPAISTLLKARDEPAPHGGEAVSGVAAATEANYVLGVAIGYALRVDQAANSPPLHSAMSGGRLRRLGHIGVSPVADRAALTPARNDQKSTLTLRRATR